MKSKQVSAAVSEIGKPKHGATQKCGAGDLGSNKFHFIVCNKKGDVIDHVKGTPEIGRCLLLKPPAFQDDHIERAVEVLAKASQMFQKHQIPPARVRAVGTAALRDIEKAIEDMIASGDAAAAAKAQGQIARLRAAFLPYSFKIISEDEEALWVASAAITELYVEPAPEIHALCQKHGSVTVAHLGGRTAEIIKLNAGEIEAKAVLDYGVHNTKMPQAACKAPKHGAVKKDGPGKLDIELTQKWDEGSQSLLAVGGGIWRAIGGLVCPKGTIILSREIAEIRLALLAKQGEAFFKKHVPEKRAAHAAKAAEALLKIIRHIDAQEIAFMDRRMVSEIALSVQEGLEVQAVVGSVRKASKRPGFPPFLSSSVPDEAVLPAPMVA